MRKINVAQDLTKQVAAHVAEACRKAIKEHGRFVVGISGGSLPKVLGECLPREQLEWSKWFVFYADERLVEHSSPDSNHGLVKREFLEKTAIPASQVFAVNESLVNRPQEAASDYEKQLESVFGPGIPQFDMILLGIGPDGHTCSLFPGHDLLNFTGRVGWLVDSPKPPPSRITLTFPVLNAASECVFVCGGQSKAQIIHEIVDLNCEYPCSMVSSAKVYWFLDADAASLLSK